MLLSMASSAASLSVQAVVDPDLKHVRGQLTTNPGLSFSDPLALMPAPQDDLTLSRTYPGAVDEGEMTWTLGGEELNPVSYTHLTLPTTPYV